jgi:hypothetical protein
MNTRAIPLLSALILAAAGLLPSVAWGQGARPADFRPIGKVQSVKGEVTIRHSDAVVLQANLPAGDVRQAKVDDYVYRNDVIQTSADGVVGIIFGDGTTFNISKNAHMEINEFVYDPKSTSNSTLFSLTKGTFTFLAGHTAKSGNMRVETPVGTMGIRGTAPHVEIADDGTVKFATLFELNKHQMKDLESVKPRRAEIPSSPADAAHSADERTWLRIRPTICRGC